MKELDDLLNCSICSGYMSDPITMHCGHSFCKKCAVDWCFKYKRSTCPVCRKKIRKSLPGININLKQVIEYVISMGNSRKKPTASKSTPKSYRLLEVQFGDRKDLCTLNKLGFFQNTLTIIFSLIGILLILILKSLKFKN